MVEFIGAKRIMQGPLKYHGGKQPLASKIVALMPPHLHYVEPYFGGGAVLFAKDPEGVSEVANDIDEQLMNFWLVLRHYPEEFQKLVETIPVSEQCWLQSRNSSVLASVSPSKDRIVDAVNWFVMIRQSLAGRGQSFHPLSRNRTRRGMNEQASAWWSAVDGLPEVYYRLRRVVLLNRPAVEVIKQQDGPNTLYYCDPPYLHATRACPDVYAYEMDSAQHDELLSTLVGVRGKFLLSGYPNDLYAQWAGDNGWWRADFDVANHASGESAKRRMTECVWTNYDPTEYAHAITGVSVARCV